VKKAEVLKKNFPQTTLSEPCHAQAEAFAPTNIALCKYWGKRDHELNLPLTSSLSISLPEKGAAVKLIPAIKDQIILNGHTLTSDTIFVRRLVAFLDLFRQQQKWSLTVDITMNIPMAAGLASSACGFASLAKALNNLLDWQLTEHELSIIARLGSGSATRSLWPGFVEWHVGVRTDGMDSYGEPLDHAWPELCLGLAIMSDAIKPISSRDAMRLTVETSTLYGAWPTQVNQDLRSLKEALHHHDFSLLGRTAESNALAMHATMLSSWPPICYALPDTLTTMQKIWALRQQGLELYFTQDAGPNLKLLFLNQDANKVREHFSGLEIVKSTIGLSSSLTLAK
jgi:diphosphomevalonate decarboxylase